MTTMVDHKQLAFIRSNAILLYDEMGESGRVDCQERGRRWFEATIRVIFLVASMVYTTIYVLI